jgi:hypothetical protein
MVQSDEQPSERRRTGFEDERWSKEGERAGGGGSLQAREREERREKERRERRKKGSCGLNVPRVVPTDSM